MNDNSQYVLPLKRLIAYSNILESTEHVSISYLSDILIIPIEVIREDIDSLIKKCNEYIYVDFYYVYTEREELELIAESLNINNAKLLSQDILVDSIEDIINDKQYVLSGCLNIGLLDSVPVRIRLNIHFPERLEEYLRIPVEVDEYMAYFNIFEQSALPKQVSKERSTITTTIRNKKYVCEFKPEILENLNQIEEAIKGKQSIGFMYQPYGNRSAENIIILPYKIGYDATENRYVVISMEDNNILVYDLEYISNIIYKNIKIEYNKEIADHFENYYDKVWGFEYDKMINENGEPVPPQRIKLIFYNEANVIKKAYRDLAFRNPITLKEDTDENLIYEDDIYGENSFLDWMYSFGSSVQLLSPSEIVDRVKKDLETRKSMLFL